MASGLGHPSTVPIDPRPLCFPPAMARICHSCGKRPAFGQSRSHSMVATKRRFDAESAEGAHLGGRCPEARLRLHPLPQGGQGHQGVAGRPLLADPSLVRFRTVVQRSLAELEARREEVNDLNVFPVADGDTGDNMALTLRAVLDELDRLSGGGALDEIGREEIVDSVARAALLGARGNSGVILSQLIRGAAEELASRPGELVDPVLIGAAMAHAADRAYDSVREPAEGTILTVVREMAHRVASELAHMQQPRLEAGRRRAPGRADRRGARARARRGPEVGPARAGPAARPARGRRGRRRRLRPDRDLRRRRRGAARDRGARARPPRACARHASAARVARRSATARTSPSPARGWSLRRWSRGSSRSATRCSSSATRGR